jgi:hypothetical protein
VAGKHPRLTTVGAVVMVESEGVRAELATHARPMRRCSGTDKVTSAHRQWDPCPNRGEHQKGEVRVSLRVQAIEKPSTLWALPPITDAAVLFDWQRVLRHIASQRAQRELGEVQASISLPMLPIDVRRWAEEPWLSELERRAWCLGRGHVIGEKCADELRL